MVSAPGFTRIDLGLFRNFKIREGLNFQLREAFNALNHTNLGSPGTASTTWLIEASLPPHATTASCKSQESAQPSHPIGIPPGPVLPKGWSQRWLRHSHLIAHEGDQRLDSR